MTERPGILLFRRDLRRDGLRFFVIRGIERRGSARWSSGYRKHEARVREKSKTTDLNVRPFYNDLFHPVLQAVLAKLTAEVVLQRAEGRVDGAGGEI